MCYCTRNGSGRVVLFLEMDQVAIAYQREILLLQVKQSAQRCITTP
jgi:hypothetical protein